MPRLPACLPAEEAFNRSLSQPFQPQPLPEDCEDYDKGCKGGYEDKCGYEDK
jgi:hypothetical protein